MTEFQDYKTSNPYYVSITVGELIKALERFPKDLQVRYDYDQGEAIFPIHFVGMKRCASYTSPLMDGDRPYILLCTDIDTADIYNSYEDD